MPDASEGYEIAAYASLAAVAAAVGAFGVAAARRRR